MGLSGQVRFPCDCIPAETRMIRLLGIYSQRQKGLVLQRVKIPGGRIRMDQWRCLAESARQYTPEYPLHITTRQDVELHGIHPRDVPAIQTRLAALGMTCVGAAGDTMRNIAVCPEDGFRHKTWEVAGLAESIRTHAESLDWIASLPRKFKISICGCGRSCARAWIQDLGLIANIDGTFRVIAAGSLGSKPGSGMLLFESLEIDKVLPLVHAVLTIFHAEGDRTNRNRARLRHVRERFGDKAFAERVEMLLQVEAAKQRYPIARLSRVESDTPLQFRLSLPLGDIMPEDACDLARAIEDTGSELRFGLQHDLFVFGETKPVLSSALADLINDISIVSCPGSTWCTRGIADSRGAAQRIRQRLPEGCRVSIAVGGCANNCSQAAVAPIGLLGRMKRLQGKLVEGFRISIGGGSGQTPALGHQLHDFVPAEDVDEAVSWLVQRCGRSDNLSMPDFSAVEFNHLEEEFRLRFGVVDEPSD